MSIFRWIRETYRTGINIIIIIIIIIVIIISIIIIIIVIIIIIIIIIIISIIIIIIIIIIISIIIIIIIIIIHVPQTTYYLTWVVVLSPEKTLKLLNKLHFINTERVYVTIIRILMRNVYS